MTNCSKSGLVYDTMPDVVERLTKSNKVKRKRKHGYLARKKTVGGKRVLKRRTQKGRKRITI